MQKRDTQIADLRNALTQSEDDRDKKARRIRELEDAKTDLGKHLTECKLEYDNLSKEYGKLKTDFETITDDKQEQAGKITALINEMASLKDQIATDQLAVQAYDAQVTTLRNQVRNLEDGRKDALTQLANCQRQYKNADEERARLRDQVAEMDARLNMADGTKTFLIEEKKQCEDENKRLRQENASLKEELGTDAMSSGYGDDYPLPLDDPQEITIESPDRVVIKIFFEENSGKKDFFLRIDNNRP